MADMDDFKTFAYLGIGAIKLATTGSAADHLGAADPKITLRGTVKEEST